jgi:hypothetical protein
VPFAGFLNLQMMLAETHLNYVRTLLLPEPMLAQLLPFARIAKTILPSVSLAQAQFGTALQRIPLEEM